MVRAPNNNFTKVLNIIQESNIDRLPALEEVNP